MNCLKNSSEKKQFQVSEVSCKFRFETLLIYLWKKIQRCLWRYLEAAVVIPMKVHIVHCIMENVEESVGGDARKSRIGLREIDNSMRRQRFQC